MNGWQGTLETALGRTFNDEDPGYTVELARGTLEVGLYRPPRPDPQQPHQQDELYFVVSGHGWFVNDGDRSEIGPGDALFVAAGVPHRFEDFSDDLTAWVVFYGPPGGEQPGDAGLRR